jgi:cytochrome c-type biogenesis protein CcmH/NrfF
MVVVNPFVFWIWVGGVVMIFGTFIALWPQAEVVRVEGRARAGGSGGGGAGRDDDEEAEAPEALAHQAKLGRRALVGVALFAALSGAALWPWGARADQRSLSGDAPEVERLHPEERLIHTLIQCECKGCSGQSIANCHPGCGEGIRDRARVHAMLADGKSREQILAVFVAERGEGVLMSPPIKGFNQLVWILPVAVMAAGIPLVVMVARRRRAPKLADAPTKAPPTDDDAPLSPAQRLRLERLERDLEAMD